MAGMLETLYSTRMLVGVVGFRGKTQSVFQFFFQGGKSYGGHGNLALEAAADGIVNTLGLAPGTVDYTSNTMSVNVSFFCGIGRYSKVNIRRDIREVFERQSIEGRAVVVEGWGFSFSFFFLFVTYHT